MTDWFSQTTSRIWNSVTGFFKDLPAMVVGTFLGLFASLLEAIPIPDFVKSFSLSSILSAAGPQLGYFMTVFKFPEGFAAIGSGYAFRLLRKFLTLFQW
ncbi:hypothetical protein [Xanthomonas sp. NCPPB 2632]|uniref:hypothetical protein n=1 Tax=Xanthomonas sp. NCPPB 2632 TaxID=3240912 RepID=UPI00351626D5